MSSASEIDKYITNIFNNKIIYTVIVLFVSLYGGLAAPKLPKKIASYFDNEIFKLIIVFVIALLSSKDFALAILATISLLVTINTLTIHKINDNIIKVISTDIDNKLITKNNSSSSPSVPSTPSGPEDATNLIKPSSNNSPVSPSSKQSLPPTAAASTTLAPLKKETFTYMNDNIESFTLDSPSPFDDNNNFATF